VTDRRTATPGAAATPGGALASGAGAARGPVVAPGAGAAVDTAEASALSQRIAAVLALDPSAPAVEFERRWHSWGELAASADAVAPHVVPGLRVGVLLRNRPAHVGLLLGLLRAGACVVAVNPDRGDDRVRTELAALDVPVLAGDPADLAAVGAASPAPVRLASAEPGAVTVDGTPDPGLGGSLRPGVAVEMLTSGTTGPPKRVPLGARTFVEVLAGAKHYERSTETGLRLRTGVAVVNAPLVHVGGLFRVLQCVSDGRSFCLLERFTVDDWVDAVRRHRPRTASLVPAALRMVLDADLDPGDLASLRSVVSGTAPLSPDDADAFFDTYGVPVLVSYGATEFGGGVAGWNLADHERWWKEKRGSVGRAHPGCELRVVDVETGEPLGVDGEGLLEVRARPVGDGRTWTRTTDLARIDADGFLYVVGRSDQAIIRGGFKVIPDTVREALERDPRVRGAAVVGRPDERLGAVPVAAVELRPGAAATGAELLDAASVRLARYELPVEVRVVAALPRTPSGKVDLPAVRALLGGGDGWT
jgi:acyl-CoA synthetase (AMP-forming)/AMP-acid ligase II